MRDVSSPQKFLDALDELSPRMRGCFQNQAPQVYFVVAFPAYAGCFRLIRLKLFLFRLSPRMRDVSMGAGLHLFWKASFPAYAGMFLKRFTRKALLTSFPRVCGMFRPREHK